MDEDEKNHSLFWLLVIIISHIALGCYLFISMFSRGY